METCVEFCNTDKTITVFSNETRYVQHIKRLAEQYPDDVVIKVDETDLPEGGMIAWMPKAWFRMPKPPAKRGPMSEEQRAAAVARLAAYREAQEVN